MFFPLCLFSTVSYLNLSCTMMQNTFKTFCSLVTLLPEVFLASVAILKCSGVLVNSFWLYLVGDADLYHLYYFLAVNFEKTKKKEANRHHLWGLSCTAFMVPVLPCPIHYLHLVLGLTVFVVSIPVLVKYFSADRVICFRFFKSCVR